jgi:mono/diheme cytochrome c family protein
MKDEELFRMRKFSGEFVLLVIVMLLLGACGGDDPALADAPTPMPTTEAAPASNANAPNDAAPTLVSQPVENQPAAPPAGDATKGRQLFTATCSACHGPNGEGVKGLGKDMKHSEFIASLSDEELLAFIKRGRPIDDPLNTTGVIMPPKGGNPALSDEQLLDIIAFIRSIHQ